MHQYNHIQGLSSSSVKYVVPTTDEMDRRLITMMATGTLAELDLSDPDLESLAPGDTFADLGMQAGDLIFAIHLTPDNIS